MASLTPFKPAPFAQQAARQRAGKAQLRPVQPRTLRFVPAAQVQNVTGVVFEPFAEAQSELAIVENKPATESIARCVFAEECEAALNEQINIEYNVSYVYHALFAYFDRDNVGLPGFASYFKAESEEERGHAELLMKYQNVRGGKVKLLPIMMPELEFDHVEKGEALYAMELSLSLEKLNFQKLRHLHAVASKHEDADMTNFIEEKLLQEQAQTVKKVSEYVSQLRRIGKGHGVWHFDKELAA